MIKFKLYLDKDEETIWLNKMSSKGYAFKKFFLGFYKFEECEPEKYTYQIDLLNNWNGDKEEFAAFLEESGVEVISQWYRWVFIRKKASEGNFEMYSDKESKIEQYSRIRKFFMIGLIIESICLLVEFNAALHLKSAFYWGVVILLAFIVVCLLRMVWKCGWKISQLKNEN